MVFTDRQEAGKKLAEKLEKYKGRDTIIYALPRGGVVVGAEIAKILHCPLDLIIVRKVGHPYQPEYAVCAVAENSHLICNEEEVARIDQQWLKKEIEKERQEAVRRHQVYLSGLKLPAVKGKVAVLVDDGIATGLTMETAIQELRHGQPQKLVVAVPVAPKETVDKLSSEVDEVVGLSINEYFLGAIGAYYEYFPQVSDEEVIQIMKEANKL